MNPRPEILLHPNIPKPLHGLAPRVILGDAWWDEVRHKAYKKAEFKCQACGVHKRDAMFHRWLEAHELYKLDYPAGTMEMTEIVALCHSCHNFIHSGRLEMMVRDGRCTPEKQEQIMNHGEGILFAAGLERPHFSGGIAEWSKWRLIIDGKEYYSKFKDIDEWREFYRRGT